MLLLSYCQAIVFYLLLKAEAQDVKDHPVVGRLVDLKLSIKRVSCFSYKLLSPSSSFLALVQFSLLQISNFSEYGGMLVEITRCF